MRRKYQATERPFIGRSGIEGPEGNADPSIKDRWAREAKREVDRVLRHHEDQQRWREKEAERHRKQREKERQR